MKKTFQELSEVDSMVAGLYKNDPKLIDTKFGYAYKMFYKNNFDLLRKKFLEEIHFARIDNALEDEHTHALLTDDRDVRGYKYSKEGLKAVMKAEERIIETYDKKEVTIQPFTSSFLPELTESQVEMLSGLLIAKDK